MRGRHALQGSDRGAVLPAVLLLLAAATLTMFATLRSTTSATRLTNILLSTQNAFAVAELGIAAGLRAAATRPATLPETGTWELPPQSFDGMGRYTAFIRPTGHDNHCPMLAPLPAQRQHFEVVATGHAIDSITTTHVQGFYVCREQCTTAGCIAAELPPVRLYWTLNPETTP